MTSALLPDTTPSAAWPHKQSACCGRDARISHQLLLAPMQEQHCRVDPTHPSSTGLQTCHRIDTSHLLALQSLPWPRDEAGEKYGLETLSAQSCGSRCSSVFNTKNVSVDAMDECSRSLPASNS